MAEMPSHTLREFLARRAAGRETPSAAIAQRLAAGHDQRAGAAGISTPRAA
jgi:hypothetical protein